MATPNTVHKDMTRQKQSNVECMGPDDLKT